MGLTRRLKRTPAFQIQRALLAMQFTRAQARLARLPAGSNLEPRIRCARASRTSTRTSSPRSPTGRASRKQWLEDKKRAVLEQWEQVDLQSKLRDIERGLSLQRRRLRILHAQLA